MNNNGSSSPKYRKMTTNTKINVIIVDDDKDSLRDEMLEDEEVEGPQELGAAFNEDR